MPGSPTLSSRQRAHVLKTDRSRSHRNSTLWLVYSVKQDQDILLHSNRSLVHWLAFLETDSSVMSFRPVTDDLVAHLRLRQELLWLGRCSLLTPTARAASSRQHESARAAAEDGCGIAQLAFNKVAFLLPSAQKMA